jgi:UDP-N-acetylglucosamine acyltransferase
MNTIHPTAIISSKAKLGDNIEIAPFVLIQDDVEIGDGCRIGPHVTINNGARIGKGVTIYQGASISHVPQHKKYNNEPTICVIGDNTTIHEFASIHRGADTGKTELGSDVLIMAYAHVAHDCRIGNHCILSNTVQLAGFTQVDEWAIIGGSVPVHQFTRIGKHVMIGDGYKVGRDVLPYTLAAGEPLSYYGLNYVGLRRRGFTEEQIADLKNIYSIIYDPKLNVSQAKEKLMAEMPDNKYAIEIIEFINNSKRGIITR